MQKINLIIVGDLHLLEKNPVCRLDNLPETQVIKLQFIKGLQAKYNCPVIFAGDVFDHWKPSPELISLAAKHFPKNSHSIYGNHDLQGRKLEHANTSGLHTLITTGVIQYIHLGHWDTPFPKKYEYQDDVLGKIYQETGRKIGVRHVMTYQGEKPHPDCKDLKASALLRRYSDYDLLITGHNHKPFTEEYNGRVLVNAGGVLRGTAAEQNHLPRVYIWSAENNSVEAVYLPITEGVISRDHLDKEKQKNERLDTFIENLNKDDIELSVNFEQTLLNVIDANTNLKAKTKELILKSINK